MDDTNERKVDLLAEAGELLKRYSSHFAVPPKEPNVILASAILAVAGELRDIHNVLANINSNLNETHHLLDDLTIVEFGDSPDGPETLCYRYLRIGEPR